jgi:hypothetical protein
MKTTQKRPHAWLGVEIDESHNKVVFARVYAETPGDLIEATGAAMKDPDDSYDADTGVKLALGRALVDLGRALKKQGWSQVRR